MTMVLRIYFLLAGLVLRIFALSIEPRGEEVSEEWSLLHFRRACLDDQSQCDYSFLVSEDSVKAPKYCSFAIDAAKGLPAYQVSFSGAKCAGTPEYSINGGWDERRFVTLTIINEKRNLLSFFSFKDEDLANGVETAPQHSRVFSHPVPVRRGTVPENQQDDLAYASEWRLMDVIRHLDVTNQGSSSESVVMSFLIEGGDAPEESCLLQILLYEGDQPLGQSFYDRECGRGGWRVSWGHNEITDEAVMTLVNKNHDRHAFFGFNDVSKKILLGSTGPSPTQPL